MNRNPVPRRGWIWLVVFAILVVLALIRVGVYFSGRPPLLPLAPEIPLSATPISAPQAGQTSNPNAAVTAAPTRGSPRTATVVPSVRIIPSATARPTRTATRVIPPSATPALPSAPLIPTPLPSERLPTISYDALPAEAQEAIGLIESGGPFPYRQDGSVFQNREGLLPARSSGYYREYTVETPGSSDRGARRIIAGQQGELYYTADHYASFERVVP
jgi:ribonuclease T1